MKRCMLCKLRQNVHFLNTTDKMLDFIIISIPNIIGTREIKSDEAYYLSKLTCQSHMELITRIMTGLHGYHKACQIQNRSIHNYLRLNTVTAFLDTKTLLVMPDYI